MNKVSMKGLIFLSFMVCSNASETSQQSSNDHPLVLQANFSQESNKIGTVFDFFDVAVRTERGNPKSKPATFGRTPQVNTVRMLGGWFNQNISGDTYQWNGQDYVYHFEPATQRIDSWLQNDWDIFQIVLDNPPWAFQRGYTFVEQADGEHYLQKDRVGVYGNGLPPNDAKAWNDYIQAFLRHLVNQYGKEKVASWRFRVGSEIDTRPQHWSDTRQAFFNHYKNTVSAIHAVIPDAKVGAHFREATHVSKYVDYTGNTENAYAPYFVEWAKQNNVPYHFLAISYYPHITHEHEMDMQEVYHNQIAPILDHPDFNAEASFEIHEYKFIVKMKRAGFVSVATSHNSAFFAMLSKMLLEKNIREVFQWGNAHGGNFSPEAMTQLALHDMVGNALYKNTLQGKPVVKGNRVDGIFTQLPSNKGFDVITFNFNKRDFSYQKAEPLHLSLKVNKAGQSKFEYRVAQIDKSTNPEQMFFSKYPKANAFERDGGWRLEKSHPTGSIQDVLNEEGQALFRQYRKKLGKVNSLEWSQWKKGKTHRSNHGHSIIDIASDIPSFAVQKYQIRWVD
jgi:hypothetical protein